jgi:hypothetical protein
MDNVTVRLATVAELPALMPLAVAAAEENGFLTARKEYLVRALWPALNQDHALCGVIGPVNGPLEGFVLLHIGTIFYSDQECLEEKVVFVPPEYRAAKGGRARKLCEFSKHAADTLNLPLLIGICSSSRTVAKVKLYQRIFGEPSGAYWLYRTKTGGHEVVS